MKLYKNRWPMLHLRIEIPFIQIHTEVMCHSHYSMEYNYVVLHIELFKWKFQFSIYDSMRRMEIRKQKRKAIKNLICPQCERNVAKLIPDEPTDEAGAEFDCYCGVKLYMSNPGFPFGKLIYLPGSEYCDSCKCLSLTEEEQQMTQKINTDSSLDHICLKYNTKLYHLSRHPHITRDGHCVKEDGYEEN